MSKLTVKEQLAVIKDSTNQLKSQSNVARRTLRRFMEDWNEATEENIDDGGVKGVALVKRTGHNEKYFLEAGSSLIQRAKTRSHLIHENAVYNEYIDDMKDEDVVRILERLPKALQEYRQMLKNSLEVYSDTIHRFRNGSIEEKEQE